MAVIVEREEIRRLVELLPDSALEAAASMMRGLIAAEVDPVMLAIASAPYDDEPVSPEEEEAVRRGREQADRGELISDADLWRELGGGSRDSLD